MTMLAALTFRSVTGADAVAVLLRSLDAGRPPGHTDVALVRWEPGERRPTTRHLQETSTAGRVDQAFWGLLFGYALFAPLLHSAVEGTTTAPPSPLSEAGIDDDFLTELREAVVPGTSALLLLASGRVVDLVADASTDAYADLIQIHLTREEERALTEVFGETPPRRARRAPTAPP